MPTTWCPSSSAWRTTRLPTRPLQPVTASFIRKSLKCRYTIQMVEVRARGNEVISKGWRGWLSWFESSCFVPLLMYSKVYSWDIDLQRKLISLELSKSSGGYKRVLPSALRHVLLGTPMAPSLSNTHVHHHRQRRRRAAMSPRAGRLAAYGLLLSLCVLPALSTNIVDSRNSTSWSRADQSYRLSVRFICY